jgi:hypothetical protein
MTADALTKAVLLDPSGARSALKQFEACSVVLPFETRTA